MPAARKPPPAARESRQGLLGAITTPLIFFGLALLVVESFLGLVLATGKLTGTQNFYVVLVMAALFLAVVVIVALLTFTVPKHLLARLDEVVREKVAEQLEDFSRQRVKVLLKKLQYDLKGFCPQEPVDALQANLTSPGLTQNPYLVYLRPALEKILEDPPLSRSLPGPLREELTRILTGPPGTMGETQRLLDRIVQSLEAQG